MRKKWLVLSAVFVFLLAAFFSLWMERPALMQKLSETVTSTVNDKINGSLTFSAMDVSLSGKVRIQDPVIRDTQGRTVLSGSDIQIFVNPWKIVASLPDGNPAAAIETVDITKPVVHVWQKPADNTWNVAALIKTSKEKTDSGFRAMVRFHDGTVRARLADGTLITGDGGDGTLDFKSYPAIYGDMTLYVDGEKLTASGHYTSSREFDVLLHGDAVRASYASSFIPSGTDVTVEDGSLRNIRVRYARTHNGDSFSGTAVIDNLSGTASGFSYDQVGGTVRLDSQSVRVDQLKGRINGQEAAVSGEIRIDGDSPVFNLDVNVPGADLSAFADMLPAGLSGTAAFTGSIWGTAGDIHGSGTLTIPELTYGGTTLHQGEAVFSYDGSRADISHIAADAAGGHVEGSGTYDRISGDFQASLDADSIHLEEISQLPVSVLGTVSASLAISGNQQTGSLRASGHASAVGLSYNGIGADRAEGDIYYEDGLLSLTDFNASVQGGTVRVNGVYDTQGAQTNLSFTADNLPLDVVSAYLAVPVTGTFSAAGHLYGPGPDWDMIFQARNGSVQGMPFDTIDGSVSGTGGRILIPSVVWRYVDGTHTASGMADLDTRQVQLQITTQHMRLERLLPALGRGDLPLTGWADNTITITGSLDQPSAQGSFHLTSGSAYGYLYKNVSADYTLHDGTVYITNGDITAYDASIRVAGSLGQQMDLTLDGSHLDIARLVPQKGPQRSGIMNVKGHVGGTMDSPVFEGSLQSDSLTFNGIALDDIQGNLGYYGGIFRLTDFHFKQNGGTYELRGGYNPANGWIMARARVQAADLASILKVAGAPLQSVQGRLEGQLAIDGTTSDPRARLTGTLTQGYIDDAAIEPAHIDVQYENNAVQIHELTLKTGDAILAAQGSYALHGPVQMQIAARNFPARLLTAITGQKNIQIDAPVDFAANLSGTGDHPSADVSLQLGSGTVNGISFTSMYALLNLRDRMIKVNQAYAVKDPYKASASGTIPVAALTGEKTDESMNVTVKLDHAGLDILTFLTPLVTNAQGGLDGSLQLKGTAADPQVYGTLSVDNGSLSIKTVRNPLTQISGQLQFTGRKAAFSGSAVMDKAKAKNPGKLQIQADASWQGWEVTSYKGSLVLDHLGVICPYFTGPLTGNLTVSPGDGMPLLAGTVTIDDTTLDLPLSLSDTQSSLDAALDITVALGDNVRLYNGALYDLMVRGSAHFGGTLAHPHGTGGFEATRGTIHYLDTNFRVSRAKAEFNQPDTFLPSLDVEGHTRVGQYNVLLNLRGPADAMDLMLRSNPPLTKAQIISLITLRNSSGKKDSSLDSEDVNTLIGSGIRMTLNSLGVTQALEKALNLDMLNITTGSLDYNSKTADVGNNYYNIEMGKYLFNDFMLTAAFGLNHDDNRIGMQYNLGSKFGVAAWKSADDSFVGGMYKYSFY